MSAPSRGRGGLTGARSTTSTSRGRATIRGNVSSNSRGRGRGRGGGVGTTNTTNNAGGLLQKLRSGTAVQHSGNDGATVNQRGRGTSGRTLSRGSVRGRGNNSKAFDTTQAGRSTPPPRASSSVLPSSHRDFMSQMNEKFQALKPKRDAERRRAIQDGFLADPEKKTNLANAITPVGTCTDMCPQFERVERIVQNMVDRAEKVANEATGRDVPSEDRMVKRFRRSAAGYDEQLPSDIRTPETLRRTLDYLLDKVVGGGERLASIHKFVWDRTRGIRNDFSIQQVTKREDVRIAVECYERIARFHIVSLHQLANPHNLQEGEHFDAHQEREQLNNTLLSLMYYYDDNRGVIPLPNEPEFRAYSILFELQALTPDLEDRMQAWPVDLLNHPRVQTAFKLYAAAGNTVMDQGPLRPTTPFSVAQANSGKFWTILSSHAVSYIMACVAEMNFSMVRFIALDALWRSAKSSPQGQQARNQDWTLSELQNYLAFDEEDEALEFCQAFDLAFRNNDNGEQCLDFQAVSSTSLDKSSMPSQQIFSHGLVEEKRYRRTLVAVINGVSVASAIRQGLVTESSPDENDEQSNFKEDDQSMFIPEPVVENARTFGSHMNPAAAAFVPSSIFGESTKPKATPKNIFAQQSNNSSAFSAPSNPLVSGDSTSLWSSSTLFNSANKPQSTETKGQPPDTQIGLGAGKANMKSLFSVPDTTNTTEPGSRSFFNPQPSSVTTTVSDPSPQSFQSLPNELIPFTEPGTNQKAPSTFFNGGRFINDVSQEQKPPAQKQPFNFQNFNDMNPQQETLGGFPPSSNPTGQPLLPFSFEQPGSPRQGTTSQQPAHVPQASIGPPVPVDEHKPQSTLTSVFHEATPRKLQDSQLGHGEAFNTPGTSQPADVRAAGFLFASTYHSKVPDSDTPEPLNQTQSPSTFRDSTMPQPNQSNNDKPSLTADSKTTLSGSLVSDPNVNEQPLPKQPISTTVSLFDTPNSASTELQSSQQLAQPRFTEIDRANLVENTSRLILTQHQGLIEYFVSHHVSNLLQALVKQYLQDQQDSIMTRIRTNHLSRKYFILWRQHSQRSILNKRSKQRRKLLAAAMQAEQDKRQRDEAELEAILAATHETRQIQEQQRKLKAQAQANKGGETHDKEPVSQPVLQVVGQKRKTVSTNASPRSTSGMPQRVGPSHKRSRTVGAVSEPSMSMRIPANSNRLHNSPPRFESSRFGRSLADWSNDSTRSRRSLSQKVDSTKTDYFKLKAMGIDPNTPLVPDTVRSLEIKESRNQEAKQAMLTKARTRPSVFSTSVTSRSASPAGLHSEQPTSTSVRDPAQLSQSVVPTAPQPEAQLEDDDPFLKQLKQARKSLAQNAEWFKTQSAVIGKEIEEQEKQQELRRSFNSQTHSRHSSPRTSINGLATANGYEYFPSSDISGKTLSRTEERIRRTGAHGLATRPPGKEYVPVAMSRQSALRYSYGANDEDLSPGKKRGRENLSSPTNSKTISAHQVEEIVSPTKKRAKQDSSSQWESVQRSSAKASHNSFAALQYQDQDGTDNDDDDELEEEEPQAVLGANYHYHNGTEGDTEDNNDLFDEEDDNEIEEDDPSQDYQQFNMTHRYATLGGLPNEERVYDDGETGNDEEEDDEADENDQEEEDDAEDDDDDDGTPGTYPQFSRAQSGSSGGFQNGPGASADDALVLSD